MRWEDLPQSDNVEDRRSGGDGGGGGGGGFGLPGGRGGLGVGTIVVLGIVGWALGIDPRLLIGGAEILSGGSQARYEQPVNPPSGRPAGAPGDDMGKFVARVLGSTEVQWSEIFRKAGQRYQAPKLVMYAGGTRSGCGVAQSAMGPFYCPSDQRVYLDTAFFREIETRFRGCDVGSRSCQFVQAYIIAHEVGHHVQNLLGILTKAHQLQQTVSKAESNRVQVRVELQADCFAGVWANRSDERWKLIQPGDVEAAMRTAAAIGDDTLQRRSQGHVVPDAFTHGSAEQRQRWFTVGLKQGTVASCNTFGATQL
ncbi:MAG: neutral zinc metallopeptidase [Proteobacteria bacterium]|nr:neutral zinc metallopeptidase [Pseudomonadota bacterium]